MSGKARLQFTRVPYTHWSLSFYSDPVLELEVQSQFQGRQLQPQIISIITSQIRKAVKRKHTLPRYKMRYKPFFRRLNDEAVDLSEVRFIPFIFLFVTHSKIDAKLIFNFYLNLLILILIPPSPKKNVILIYLYKVYFYIAILFHQVASTQLTPGYLEVVLLEISRLNLAPINSEDSMSQVEVYCTISVDSTPWIYLTQYGGVPYMVLDLIISKTGSQQLGVVFKQEVVPEIGQMCVLVETIVSGSPAAIAEMRKGDILVAVDGKKVSSMNQVAKFVKSAVQRRFIIRVERRYSKADSNEKGGQRTDSERTSFTERKALKSDPMCRVDSPSAEDAGKMKFETQIKFSDLRDSDVDLADIRPDTNKLFKRRKSSIQTEEVAQTPDTTPSRRISTISTSSASSSNVQFYFSDDSSAMNVTDLYYSTKEKPYASLITFEETKSFRIDSELQYLNIGVWGRAKGGETPRLLGYINAPVKLILAQCCTSSTGHYLKCHALLPPESCKCYRTYCNINYNFYFSM